MKTVVVPRTEANKHPIREQSLNSQPSQKTFLNSPSRRSTEATPTGFHRPFPIAVMSPSRMQNTALFEDLSRYRIEDCFYSPEAQKSNA
ncbi:hypothetical protein TNCV_3402001 [Trichonephila clavipes]|nr:hypothetical protein TNCV_3402001 [Trichonephila clavipes]